MTYTMLPNNNRLTEQEELDILKKAASSAKKKAPTWLEVEDITNMGYEGLLEAYEKFDFGSVKNKSLDEVTAFKKYATQLIQLRLIDKFRQIFWLPKAKIRKIRARGKSARFTFFNNFTDISSIISPTYDNDEASSIIDAFLAPKYYPDETAFVEFEDFIEKVTACLNERDKSIIIQRIIEGKTYPEIAADLNHELTDTRVCQIVKDFKIKALEKLEELGITSPSDIKIQELGRKSLPISPSTLFQHDHTPPSITPEDVENIINEVRYNQKETEE